MIRFQTAGRRQNQVGVFGGLVNIDVQRDVKVEPADGLFQLSAVGRRKNGVARVGDQAADLSFARSQNLFAQNSDRQVAFEFRQTTDARLPAVEFVNGSLFADQRNRGVGEHLPAGFIEIARDQVDRVN